MPTGSPAAYAGGELESTQNAVDAGAENVQHRGQGGREEPDVFRRDLRTATKLGKAEGAGGDRDEAERDQPGNYEPAVVCVRSHVIYVLLL